MSSTLAEVSNGYGQTSRAADGSTSGKVGPSYSGAVAQRVLFGSYKRSSCGRRTGSKSSSAPSRLSKVSGADNSTS